MKTKKFPVPDLKIFLLILVIFTGLSAEAQDILLSYQRSFVRANLADKASILEDAATDERAPEFIRVLYEYALDFAINNAAMLGNDPDMIAVAVEAARGLGKNGNGASAELLWNLFASYHDRLTRTEAMKSLGLLAGGNARVIDNINHFLMEQTRLYRSSKSFEAGTELDAAAIQASIETLGVLGSISSFAPLFEALNAGYPLVITGKAQDAIDSLQENIKSQLLDIIKNGLPSEKLSAFRLVSGRSSLSDTEQGELAEAALNAGLSAMPGSAEEETALSTLRYEAVPVLTRLQWAGASPAAIRHFYRVQADYQNGAAPQERFLEAISCLSVMGTPEAVQALVLQLGSLNSHIERDGEYDEAVALAVIKALGTIGDKSAFDYLLYISYLSYSEQVQTAAREALNQLRW
ncbi:MAG: HEAT repeat domain-containing protein [Treponema sp.]|jgi:HEAT repeat protein|nr:HEAT repeat domain-containing protein [Treponema sp.]